MNYYFHDDQVKEDGVNAVSAGTQWGAAGCSYYEKACSTNGETIIYSAERIAANKYDFLVTAELSDYTAIERFALVGGPNQQTANATYAVYVGDNEANLYSAENQVFLFDAYNNYKDGADWKFNGGGSGVARGTESQYLEFTGDTLPTGKFVGIKFYDACVDALTTYPAYLIDFFVSGETVAMPKGNLTHLDETSATSVSYADKLDKTTIKLDEKYTANIQLANMVGSALKAKVANDTNLIGEVRYKGYTGEWKNITSGLLTDMLYYNHDDAGNAGTNFTGNTTNFNGVSYEATATAKGEAIVYGQDRIDNDYYDILITTEPLLRRFST